jgi:hypothetical protein
VEPRCVKLLVTVVTAQVLSVTVFAALLSAQSGGGGKVPSPAAVSRGEQAKLMALLPEAGLFGGAASRPAQFYSADLYKYLDGGADAYLRAGFAALIHREYKAPDADFTADIYDMGDPAHAFARYAAERPPECRKIELGNGGYVDEGLLNFVDGPYYVKLLAFGEAGKTAAALEKAARGISARIAAGRAGGARKD